MNAASYVLLALCVWREASNQSREAQAGVVWCVLERVKSPGWWGSSILGVITKRWQFSSMTAAGDPNLTRWPTDSDPSWAQCLTVVNECMSGSLNHPAPGADSYYSIDIPAPRWATDENFIKQVGRFRFHHVGVNG